MNRPSREAIQPLIDAKTIARRVGQLANQISTDFDGRELTVIGILKGAWIFMADLVRELTIPVVTDFMTVSSYGAGTQTSGVIKIVADLKYPLKDRHVLLVEDILDTGLTMRHLLDHLAQHTPASLKICVLMDKPARRKTEIRADYVGFEVPDRFVVGYGVDFAEHFRQLPFIGCIEQA